MCYRERQEAINQLSVCEKSEEQRELRESVDFIDNNIRGLKDEIEQLKC